MTQHIRIECCNALVLLDLTQHAVAHEDTYIDTHVGGLTLHVDLLCGYEPMLHGLIGPVGV